jgi:hypothetical protein
VEVALTASRVRCTTVREHEIRARAARRLGRSPAELDDALRAFSRMVGTPWRAPEKAAALAAWLTLADG